MNKYETISMDGYASECGHMDHMPHGVPTNAIRTAAKLLWCYSTPVETGSANPPDSG